MTHVRPLKSWYCIYTTEWTDCSPPGYRTWLHRHCGSIVEQWR